MGPESKQQPGGGHSWPLPDKINSAELACSILLPCFQRKARYHSETKPELSGWQTLKISGNESTHPATTTPTFYYHLRWFASPRLHPAKSVFLHRAALQDVFVGGLALQECQLPFAGGEGGVLIDPYRTGQAPDRHVGDPDSEMSSAGWSSQSFGAFERTVQSDLYGCGSKVIRSPY